jgi:hypothetical protein
MMENNLQSRLCIEISSVTRAAGHEVAQKICANREAGVGEAKKIMGGYKIFPLKKIFFATLYLCIFTSAAANDFVWFSGSEPVAYSAPENAAPVVSVALKMFEEDMRQVTGFLPKKVAASKAAIRIVQDGSLGKKEAFRISVVKVHARAFLQVAGSDARGVAYGILELSRLAGVSPWVWWSDVTPERKSVLALPDDFYTLQSPAVEYRGIFLNDEDWGLTPWSTKTFEPDAEVKFPVEKRFKGQVGPKTYEKIFQLLLRLRANTIWPAMHECTMPFYFVEGNRQMAEKYGIVVSTSHCEPMMRNSATEWDLAGKGDYSYPANKDAVLSYWEDRLKELGKLENIFTVGMRGKHDGRMQGVKNTQEYKDALSRVLDDQQALLKKYIDPDVSKIPQQFVPYKEVLEVYNAGLALPDYVTLVWPDDNHGYIRHFPSEKERARSGGNGVYYHTSYWGEPHDNLWLGIVQPALMYQQMRLAYERGIRKIWILNVGDIKPSEYLTELFLDLAWSVNSAYELPIADVSSHLRKWLQREFGEDAGRRLLPAMEEFYLLSHMRKPEFMGNTRTYDGKYAKVSDLPWSEQEVAERLLRFKALSGKVKEVELLIPESRKDAYFEMIKYPVQGAAQMNNKLLLAQLARHTSYLPSWMKSGEELWKESDAAYDSIFALTQAYSSIGSGKWKYLMNCKPRNLIVFERVAHETDALPLPAYRKPAGKFNGADFCSISGNYTITGGLGYEGGAIYLEKDCSVEYALNIPTADSIEVVVQLVPTHAVEGKSLRFSVKAGSSQPLVFDYETAEFSEEWKENVLRSQAIKTAVFVLPVEGRAGVSRALPLQISAVDEGIVVDRILVYSK